jgi:predicted kinase
VLVVFVGRPGSGKTTLARLLAAELKAAHLRMDAIETAVIRSGLAMPPLGAVGYFVAHEVAASCLLAGVPVVVDAVSPVAEARAGWRALATTASTELRVVEVVVTDPAEHRRRVEARESDMDGLLVPTWEQVTSLVYEPWDEQRDGPRLLVVNDGPPDEALVRVRTYLRPK